MVRDHDGPRGALDAEELKGSTRSVSSTDLLYSAPVSRDYIVRPRLVRRGCLAKLTRSEPEEYKPTAAEVNLNKHHGLARALNNCLEREEFRAFTTYFISPGLETQYNGNWTRWPSLPQQRESPEIRLRGESATCDSIFNNMVPMKSCWGPIQCPYCDVIILAGSMLDVFKHLSTTHPDLPEQWFTCPTCIEPVMMQRETFMGHWLVLHETASFLRHCCDDIQTSQRVSFGEALFAWLGARISYQRESSVTEAVTTRGAICWAEKDVKHTVRTVIREQLSRMPRSRRPQWNQEPELEAVTHGGVTLTMGEKRDAELALGGACTSTLVLERPRQEARDEDDPEPVPSKRYRPWEPPESGGQEPVPAVAESTAAVDPWTEMEEHFRNVPVARPEEASENLDLITSAATPFSAALEALEELATYTYQS